MYNDDYKDENEEVKKSNAILDFYYSNKKLVWILGAILLIIIVVSLIPSKDSNKSNEIVPNITMVSNKENISLNNSTKLIAGVTNIPNSVITWKSSDEKIVSVDTQGVVTGLKYGTATVTATYTHTDGKEYNISCEVTVSEGDPDIKLTSVAFPDGEVMITVGNEYQLPIIVQPSNGYITSITYTSTNPMAVSVDETGKIKANSEGVTSIKISANNGDFTDEIIVNSTSKIVPSEIIINPTNILFQEKSMKIKVGETNQLSYQYLPTKADIANLSWESSNASVATVTNGVVTALSAGTAQITVRALNNVTDTMTIEVVNNTVAVTDITLLSNRSLSLIVGQTSVIVPNVTPSDATNKMVTYLSTNSSVASVDNKGMITALSSGSSTIILTTVDGNKSVSVNVTVTSNGSSSSGSSSSGGSTSEVGTIHITSNNKSVEKTYSDAITNPVAGNTTVTIADFSRVTSVKYCTYKYGSTACDIDTVGKTANDGYSFTILGSDTGVTVIRYKKYNDTKVSDVEERFVNISTTGSTQSGTSGCYACGANASDVGFKWGSYSSTTGCSLHSQVKSEKECTSLNTNSGGCFLCSGVYKWGYYGSNSSCTFAKNSSGNLITDSTTCKNLN